MPYLIGLLILAVVFYYAWPYILWAVLCLIGLLVYRQHAHEGNIRLVERCLNEVESLFLGSYYVSSNDSSYFYRVKDLCVRARSGKKCICVGVDVIRWQQSLVADEHSNCSARSDAYYVDAINWFATDYTRESVSESIEQALISRSLIPLDDTSLDSRVCSIIFQNYPEVVWADDALAKIEDAIRPLRNAYQISLNNELLSSNTPLLKRALSALENEAGVLLEYSDEAYRAIDQCAQFLSVPQDLRNTVEYDVETLRIYAKRNQMRESFAEVLAIKEEYESLRRG